MTTYYYIIGDRSHGWIHKHNRHGWFHINSETFDGWMRGKIPPLGKRITYNQYRAMRKETQ